MTDDERRKADFKGRAADKELEKDLLHGRPDPK